MARHRETVHIGDVPPAPAPLVVLTHEDRPDVELAERPEQVSPVTVEEARARLVDVVRTEAWDRWGDQLTEPDPERMGS